MSDEIELGDTAQDTITGFKGVCIGVTKWLHGCERLTIQPTKLKAEGKPIDSQTFDRPQLRLLKKKVQPTTGRTGGPRPEPSKPSIPVQHAS